jgi:hypothetical protein
MIGGYDRGMWEMFSKPRKADETPRVQLVTKAEDVVRSIIVKLKGRDVGPSGRSLPLVEAYQVDRDLDILARDLIIGRGVVKMLKGNN